uniref:cytochrome c oxidase subunit III n=1 Tax=Pedionis papillata TaxID=3035250 RepID=UPI0024119880|nr:cytochrome c oxidase subunit III [Pedionis papillata]WEP24750.1 cytochrome c oxidase subunit III [Pedionis papillata]
MNNHPFHLVDKSPWPIYSAMGMLTLTSGSIMWMHKFNSILMYIGLMNMVMIMFQWWRDIVRESTFQGMHTKKVISSMKMGMIMFIMSEVMFFLSFFWAFFHSSLSPNMEIGMNWPPLSIKTFNPMNIPMLNTIILLTSGMSMTWAHNMVMLKNVSKMKQSLMITMILGMYFSTMQLYEYIEAQFSISDSIYGSTFFMSTGFHGIHVLIGTTFIIITFMRTMNLHFSNKHHVGLEAAAWYWHFVDVVWLFLYISVYWWGN